MDGKVIAETATTTTTEHVVSKSISKLTGLVKMEWYKLSSLPGDIDFMRKELRSMHALLEKLEAADDDDAQVRACRDEVSELAKDVQACVEDYDSTSVVAEDGGVDRDGGGRNWKNAVAASFKNITNKVATVGERHTIGSKIKKLKARINDMNDRRNRYSL